VIGLGSVLNITDDKGIEPYNSIVGFGVHDSLR
jgi:hypothetical protein